jgi:hypothetical protein
VLVSTPSDIPGRCAAATATKRQESETEDDDKHGSDDRDPLNGIHLRILSEHRGRRSGVC